MKRNLMFMASILMFAALISASLTFSLIVDYLIKRRSEIALGRKKYKLKNHIILCGLGRVGYRIAGALLGRKEKLIIIEKNPYNKYIDSLRDQGAHVFIGDAILENNLQSAAVDNAICVIAAINDDLINLEVGLNARSLKSDIRLILRIFDKDIAQEIKERLDIHLALSTSAIAAEEMVKLI